MRFFFDKMKFHIPLQKWHSFTDRIFGNLILFPGHPCIWFNRRKQRPDQVNILYVLVNDSELCCNLLVKYLLTIKVNNKGTRKIHEHCPSVSINEFNQLFFRWDNGTLRKKIKREN